MNPALWRVALLLYGSGFCALMYQTTWFREFRLIFGASTEASAVVVAIFMGGLGWGSAVLGKRADRQARPLAFYGWLEVCIAITAALSPFLLWLVRECYVALGGTQKLGSIGGTLLRLVLSGLVIGVPTFLMGGTLPAVARAVEEQADNNRRRLAVLYCSNTLGAVSGALLSTFYFLEHFGNLRTICLSALLNLAVAGVAWLMGRKQVVTDAPVVAATPAPADSPISPRFVFMAAAVVGFAFFLMEMVWFRMLIPLLGGSTYTFGLILAVALLGVGLGSACYSILGTGRRWTMGAFAVTCTLEALLLVLPFALGDRLAILTALLWPVGIFEFYGHVGAWSFVAAIVTFPGALVAGFQFPMLISLLGNGRTNVGRHTGLAYAWNTFGSIVGSIVGGFGILPLLTAPGAWRLVVGVLALLGLITLLFSRRSSSLAARFSSAACGLGAIALLFSTGPTATWRHSSIGVGRVPLESFVTRNNVIAWMHNTRRALLWEAEGRDSSVALNKEYGLAFFVNGKSDGNAREDAGTQVMSGLLGALLHPAPVDSFVIGLGTGSTAGWLGAVPGMARVDVAELESSILEVAARCRAVNHDVLSNPKVHTIIGDGREVLVTTPHQYDLIFSEPSNPYRAGVASLFTVDFYRVTAKKLKKGGYFIQWLQTYETDISTVQTAYKTLKSVFPTVESWQTLTGDLLFICAFQPLEHDLERLRQRVQMEPYRTALEKVWRVTDAEGVLARFVANNDFATAVASGTTGSVNSDDRTVMEFAFARNAGKASPLDATDLQAMVTRIAHQRPRLTKGPVDWQSVFRQRHSMLVLEEVEPGTPEVGENRINRARAKQSYVQGDFEEALAFWQKQTEEPNDLVELAMVGELFAEEGEDAALPILEKLRAREPIEADALLARLRWRQNKADEATTAFEAAFNAYRSDPWPQQALLRRALHLTQELAVEEAGPLARRLFHALEQPLPSTSMISIGWKFYVELPQLLKDRRRG